MARILAVDWDRHEARYVVANTTGRQVSVRAAESIPLVDVAEGGQEPQPDLGGSLAAALAGRRLSRAAILVGVERSSVELLHFTLPPAKDQELPELVANQAMRESQLVTEESILDFVPTEDDPTKPRAVTAAAMSREQLQRIQNTCATAGVKPTRMLLRPFASTSLFLRMAAPSEQVYLLVHRVADEVDLTVVVEGKAVFSRTVRLPEGVDDDQLTGRLLAEINRTVAATPPNELGGDPVECVYVFGGPEDHQELLGRIREDLFLPARLFDPFGALSVREELIPEDRGRFAALLGMVLDEAHGTHAVDFLNPRKPPEPVSRLRLAAIAGAVLAAVVLAIGFHIWGELSAINDDYRQQAARLRQLNDMLKKAAAQKQVIEAVADWKSSDVVWLDELRDLSIRMPSARDALLLRMSMSGSRSGGGTIEVHGLLRDPKILGNVESQIRDPYREIRSPRIQERLAERDYTWLFQASISVGRRSKTAYVSHLRQPHEQKPAAKAEALADVGKSNAPAKVKKASP